MSYPRSLDEYEVSELYDEIFRRNRLRQEGKCDYCERPVSETPCRMKDRHKVLPLNPIMGWP